MVGSHRIGILLARRNMGLQAGLIRMHFFDVTDIMLYIEKYTTVTGIQRVSFEVIKRMIERHGAQAVRLSYWDRKRHEYLSIESSFIAEMDEFDPDILSSVFLAVVHGHTLILLPCFTDIATIRLSTTCIPCA